MVTSSVSTLHTKKTASEIYNSLGNATAGSSQRQQMVETVEEIIVEYKRSMDRNNEWLLDFEEQNEATQAKQARDSLAIKRIEDNIDDDLVLLAMARANAAAGISVTRPGTQTATPYASEMPF